MDELTLTYLGIGLGIAGIIATIVVAGLVYRLQKRENKSRDDILKKINEITENQAMIIESIDKRSQRHIHWFVKHVGGLLDILIKNYRELNKRLETHQTTRSEFDLNRVMGGIYICRNSLNNLRSLAERDIPIAAGYISDPWIPGKFLDALSLLDIEILDDRQGIHDMEDDDFIVVREVIDLRIEDMKGYLKIIQQEEVIATK